MTQRLYENGLVREEDYARTMADVVLPALAACREEGYFTGAGGKRLYYAAYPAPAPRGTAVVLHGFTENEYKYAELIHSLLRAGWSVCAYDQRGHGRSWRDESLRDTPWLTHVERFGEYVEDLERFVVQVASRMPAPRVLFAHSMGGAVSALYMEKSGFFARAALCAPMIAPGRGGLSLPVAKAVCLGPIAVGKGKAKLIGSRPYSGREDFQSSAATSRARFDWYDRVKYERAEFHNSSPSYRWTLEALRVQDAILRPGGPEGIAAAVLLFSAELDHTVRAEEQRRFIARVPRGELRVVKGAKHEIFRSEDAVMVPWWDSVLKFFGAEK